MSAFKGFMQKYKETTSMIQLVTQSDATPPLLCRSA